MNILMAIVVGLMIAAGLYLIMGRRLLHLLLGVALLGNGVNMMIVTAAGLTSDNPPLVALGEQKPSEGSADPLPQALVLTAIVIGFGMLGFAVALAWRTFYYGGDDDLDTMISTESQAAAKQPAAPSHAATVAATGAEPKPLVEVATAVRDVDQKGGGHA